MYILILETLITLIRKYKGLKVFCFHINLPSSLPDNKILRYCPYYHIISIWIIEVKSHYWFFILDFNKSINIFCLKSHFSQLRFLDFKKLCLSWMIETSFSPYLRLLPALLRVFKATLSSSFENFMSSFEVILPVLARLFCIFDIWEWAGDLDSRSMLVKFIWFDLSRLFSSLCFKSTRYDEIAIDFDIS